MPRFSLQTSPIGLEVDNGAVRLVQLEFRPHLSPPCAVWASAVEPLQSADDLSAAIRRALAGGHFKGRQVVACLPREHVQVRSIRVAGPIDDTTEARVLEAVAPLLPFAGDAMRVQVLSTASVRDGDKTTCETVVMSVANGDVDGFLLPLHDAGLHVLALDSSVTAICRGIDRFADFAAADETRFVVELSRQQSHVIIACGGEIRFFKPIELGISHLTRAVARKLNITTDDAEALRRRLIEQTSEHSDADPVRQAVFDATRAVAEQLAHELVLCQRYYSVMFRGRPPRRLELAGPGANDPSLHRIFQSTLGLETRALAYSIDGGGTNESIAHGSWATAVGAALRFAPAMPTLTPVEPTTIDAVPAEEAAHV